jgi:hypothetical protein
LKTQRGLLPVRVELIHHLPKLPTTEVCRTEGLAAFFGHDEPLVLAAFEGERCCGYLPLRRTVEEPLGFEAVKLSRASPLHGHVDESCAEAMLDFLVANERFGLLELSEGAHGPLGRAAEPLEGFRFGVQCVPAPMRAAVPLARDLDTWFHGLQGWAAPLARRTRSLMASGEVEVLSSSDPRAGQELFAMYLELEARSDRLDPATGISGEARRAARYALLADGGVLFHFLLLDGLPIAATVSLQLEDKIFQLEAVCDMSFEDTAPEEVLLMLEVRDSICRRAYALELCPELLPHHARLGATTFETQVVQIYRRFGAHHFEALWRSVSIPEVSIPLPKGPMRSDLGRQLRARTHATEALDRLDASGANVERLWGDQLRAALPFEVVAAEHDRVRRAV